MPMDIALRNSIVSGGFGSAAFTPSSLDNLALWMDASMNVHSVGARQFTDANNEYFETTDTNTVISDPSTESFTIEAMIYADTLPSDADAYAGAGIYCDHKQDVAGDVMAGIKSDGAVGFGVWESAGNDADGVHVTATGVVTTLKWHHIMYVWTAGTPTLFVNGVSVAFASTGATFTGWGDYRLVGSSFPSYNLNGRMASFRFWKTAKDGTYALSAYNGGNGILHSELASTTNLITSLDMTESSGNALDQTGTVTWTDTNTVTAANGPVAGSAIDSSSSANDGTLINMDTVNAWTTDTADGTQEKTTFDSGGNNLHGVLVAFPDNPRSTDIPSVLTGGSLGFDGTDDAVNIPHNSLFDFADEIYSFSGWVKATDLDTLQYFVEKDVDGTGYGFYIHSNGSIHVVHLGGDTKVSSTGVITAGTWYHIGITSNAGAVEVLIYVDGVDVSSGADGARAITASTEPLVFSAKASGTLPFTGLMDDFRLFSSTKTPAEIAALAAGTDDTTSIVGKWKFDEANTRSLPVIGAGYSLAFDGTDDEVVVPHNASLAIIDNYTLSAWVFRTAGSTCSVMAKADGGSPKPYDFLILASGPIALAVSSGAESTISTVDNVWNHIVATYNDSGNLVKYYINGVNAGITTAAAQPTDDGDEFTIGDRQDGSTPFPGKIDDVRIYNKVLTAAEVTYLYTEGVLGTDPTTTNLPGHWKFDDGPQSVDAPTNGAAVASWMSREGNRYLFNQGTTSKQPTYLTAGINSLPAIDIDGTDDLLIHTLRLLTTTSGTAFVVYQEDVDSGSKYVFASGDEAGTANIMGIFASYTTGVNRAPEVGSKISNVWDEVSTTTLIANATPNIFTISSSGTAWALRLNGGDETEIIRNGTNSGEWWGDNATLDNTTIGGLKISTEQGFFNGKIQAIIVYSDVLTAGEITQVETYLNNSAGAF